jgi:hypothetical protein
VAAAAGGLAIMTLGLVGLVALAGLVHPPVIQQPSDVTRELTRLEQVWNDAHKTGDAAPLERLWADDLEVAVPKMAVMTRQRALDFFKSARMTFDVYDTSDLKIRIYDWVAIVTGRLQRTRSVNAQKTTDDWRFTKVYLRRDGEWRVVAFHASDAPSPGRARR